MATPVLPRPKYPVIDNDPDVRTVIGSFGLGEVVFIGAAAIGTGMLGYTIGTCITVRVRFMWGRRVVVIS